MPDTDPWNVAHRVSKGETVFMLSRRYHVPPAILADANGLTYNDALKENTTIIIPLGAYNLQTSKPFNAGDARSLYYKVSKTDDLYGISRHAGASRKMIAQWNNLENNEVRPGQILLVGWVLYDGTAINNVPVATATTTKTNATPAKPVNMPVVHLSNQQRDTPRYVMQQQDPVNGQTIEDSADKRPAPPPSSLEALFLEQTQNGENIVTEKGTAGFYKVTTQAKGVASLAFHNKAAKGAVIKVKNTNNGRYVYVKVLGPVPLTKQYNNCIIGLSDKVQAVLGVKDSKAFCELTYAGY